jgi:hypothetical protein
MQEYNVTQPLLIEHDDGVDRVTLNRRIADIVL